MPLHMFYYCKYENNFAQFCHGWQLPFCQFCWHNLPRSVLPWSLISASWLSHCNKDWGESASRCNITCCCRWFIAYLVVTARTLLTKVLLESSLLSGNVLVHELVHIYRSIGESIHTLWYKIPNRLSKSSLLSDNRTRGMPLYDSFASPSEESMHSNTIQFFASMDQWTWNKTCLPVLPTVVRTMFPSEKYGEPWGWLSPTIGPSMITYQNHMCCSFRKCAARAQAVYLKLLPALTLALAKYVPVGFPPVMGSSLNLS